MESRWNQRLGKFGGGSALLRTQRSRGQEPHAPHVRRCPFEELPGAPVGGVSDVRLRPHLAARSRSQRGRVLPAAPQPSVLRRNPAPAPGDGRHAGLARNTVHSGGVPHGLGDTRTWASIPMARSTTGCGSWHRRRSVSWIRYRPSRPLSECRKSYGSRPRTRTRMLGRIMSSPRRWLHRSEKPWVSVQANSWTVKLPELACVVWIDLNQEATPILLLQLGVILRHPRNAKCRGAAPPRQRKRRGRKAEDAVCWWRRWELNPRPSSSIPKLLRA